jgi:hypothetical protein
MSAERSRPLVIRTQVGVTIEVTRSEHGGVGLRFVPITRGLELTVEEAHKLAIVLLGGVSLPSLEAWLAGHLRELLDPSQADKTSEEMDRSDQ